jgi:hypothetical protein
MMRSTITLAALAALLATASAQTATGTEKAAERVADGLRHEVARRAGNERDMSVFARRPRHIVVLFDSSQADYREAHVVFAKGFVERLLTNLGREQQQLDIDANERHLVSVYPYQLRLEHDHPNAVRNARLRSSIITEAMSAMPDRSIRNSSWKGRGHDSSGARAELLDRLNVNSNDPNGTFVIQITHSPINQDPDTPRNDRRIRAIDARTGELENRGVVPYGPGHLFKSEPPSATQAPYDVYVWVYGPETVAAVGAPPRQPAAGTVRGGGDGLPTWLGPLALLALIGGVGYAGLRGTKLAIDGVGQTVSPFRSAILVPRDDQSVTFAAKGDPTSPVARIEKKAFRPCIVSVQHPYQMLADNSPCNENPVRKSVKYEFVKKEGSAETLRPVTFDIG